MLGRFGLVDESVGEESVFIREKGERISVSGFGKARVVLGFFFGASVNKRSLLTFNQKQKRVSLNKKIKKIIFCYFNIFSH